MVLEGRFGCGGWGTVTDAQRRGARSCSVERHPGGQGSKWMSGSGGQVIPPSRGNGVQGAGPKGLVVEGGPGGRGPGLLGAGPRGILRGLRTRQRLERRRWPVSPPARARRSGGPASARGCHGDGRAGDWGCAERRSALSLAAARGPRRRWRQRRARLCLPGGGPRHGVRRPEPSGRRAGLGAARRRPALTAAPCPAPGGAEAARGRPSTFRMLIKEYHILLPMSLDEYQVAQLYMIQVRAVGSRRPRGHTS